jgi:hypothetical protein
MTGEDRTPSGQRVGGGRACWGARPVGPGSEPGTHSGECTRAVKPFSAQGRPAEPLGVMRRPGAMPVFLRPAALAALVLIVAACANPLASGSPPTSATPSNPPTTVPSASPSGVGAIDHTTGATDVILRYEEGGGMMMAGSSATVAPIFTLYGDGTMIFRNLSRDPLQAIGSVIPFAPFRTARMNEEQIQSLLEFSLGPGGLGVARADYPNDMISDVTTAVFTVNAGGLAKKVSVYALGIESPQVPDAGARAAFVRLRDHLLDIDDGGSIKTDVYAPDRYRGILLEGQPGGIDQRSWPWPGIKATEFVGDGNADAFQIPTRVMTDAEVAMLGLAPYQGGFIGMPLAGPGDGNFYSLSLRPLLPDDKG